MKLTKKSNVTASRTIESIQWGKTVVVPESIIQAIANDIQDHLDTLYPELNLECFVEIMKDYRGYQSIHVSTYPYQVYDPVLKYYVYLHDTTVAYYGDTKVYEDSLDVREDYANTVCDIITKHVSTLPGRVTGSETQDWRDRKASVDVASLDKEVLDILNPIDLRGRIPKIMKRHYKPNFIRYDIGIGTVGYAEHAQYEETVAIPAYERIRDTVRSRGWQAFYAPNYSSRGTLSWMDYYVQIRIPYDSITQSITGTEAVSDSTTVVSAAIDRCIRELSRLPKGSRNVAILVVKGINPQRPIIYIQANSKFAANGRDQYLEPTEVFDLLQAFCKVAEPVIEKYVHIDYCQLVKNLDGFDFSMMYDVSAKTSANIPVTSSSYVSDTITLKADYFYDTVKNMEDNGWDEVLVFFENNGWIQNDKLIIPAGTSLLKVEENRYYNVYQISGQYGTEKIPFLKPEFGGDDLV